MTVLFILVFIAGAAVGAAAGRATCGRRRGGRHRGCSRADNCDGADNSHAALIAVCAVIIAICIVWIVK